MINLKVRTEYSFRKAYGPIKKVIEACNNDTVAITDNSTWGHVPFSKVCKKPIYGVEIGFVEDSKERTKQPINYMTFLAKNNKGLEEIYKLNSESLKQENFYYVPRLDYTHLFDVSDNVIIFSGANPNWGLLPKSNKNIFAECSPMSDKSCLTKKLPLIATSDNYYPTISDRKVYQVLVGRNRTDRTKPMHILNEWEYKDCVNWAPKEAIDNTYSIAKVCVATLKQANMVKFNSEKTLLQLCQEGATKLKINLKDKKYYDRLIYELELIDNKKYEDYFFVIADMVNYAKEHMLVGPARGSSAGSLVCYLLGITDVDPLVHNLLFERFIDLNRADLPDIDIDFQDDRRDMVYDYLKEKYGDANVAKLGTISRYKAKSTITEVAKELNIPQWEVNDLKGAIIERSGGDARAAFCIMDTFNDLDIGREILKKYPQMRIASDMEFHARHNGVHAAGIVVTEDAVNKYCSFNEQTQALQVDKYDAESLNLLKIDALGLRTLSVLQDVLDQVEWKRQELVDYRLDDKMAFRVLNEEKYAGIFQFEGYALQSLTRQMKVHKFEEIAALTALGRPGPLVSGGTTQYISRHTGATPTEYLHPIVKDITEITYGIVVYQEQVMEIGRHVGKLSWEDISQLRKAMSKSLGQEFFDQYWERFKLGAKENGLEESDAKRIWDNINTMGSWAFNRSHAISYGLLSYWCCVLKSKFPLQFAAACLRNVRDEEQGKKLLRELVKEGFEYLPFDKFMSQINWSVQRGKLIGGLTNIKGVGLKVAEDIINRRIEKINLTPRQEKLLNEGTTPYDDIFECERRFGHIKKEPEKHGIVSDITDIAELDADRPGTFVFFGKLTEKNLRDMNETVNLAKRGGRRVDRNHLWLNLTFEDDTGLIISTIDRFKYPRIGKQIVEEGKIGDWYLVKGLVKKGFRKVYVDKWRKLT